MAKTPDLSIEILKQIRDATAATNERLDVLTERVDQIGRRQTEAEVRVATELTEVTRAVNGVRDLLRERLDDRERIDDHERRIRLLERRSA